MQEPLLLLPGMMCDARLFFPQITAFSAQRPVMVAPLTAGETFSDIASAVLASAPPRFALAGVSMGGIAAMEIIRQAPQRISRLALLDTNPKAETPQRQSQREPQIESVLSGHLHNVMRDEMKPHYLVDAPGKPAILDLCMQMAMTLGPSVFVQQSRALQVRPDQTKTLTQVNVPTLVLCGEHDQLCPPATHELMRDLIPQATLEVITAAGHLPTLEQPERTNQVIAQWLNR
jgi:pimeloyl-ACP methyl ester carboxylesterase